MCRYRWPGNVRELEHVISRAALKAMSRGARRGDIVTLEPGNLDLDLDLDLDVDVPSAAVDGAGAGRASADGAGAGPAAAAPLSPPAQAVLTGVKLRDAVDDCQRGLIEAALAACHGNWTQAAHRLDVDPSNLHKLARRLGLK